MHPALLITPHPNLFFNIEWDEVHIKKDILEMSGNSLFVILMTCKIQMEGRK